MESFDADKMDSFNRDKPRFAAWLKQQGILGPLEPRPQDIRKATAEFYFEHSHTPMTEDERAERNQFAEAYALFDKYAVFKEHDRE